MGRLEEAGKDKRRLDSLYAAGSANLVLAYLVLAVEYLAILVDDVRSILREMQGGGES